MSMFDRQKDKNTDTDHSGVWKPISESEDLKSIMLRSERKPQLIYKHSTRCSVSFLAQQEVNSVSDQIRENADLYLVDVIQQRDLSNEIAAEWRIRHESPQLIVLKDREVLWNGSHWDVKGENILDVLQV